MSGEITCTLCSGIFEISDATVRITCGAWKVPHTVSSPLILSKEAMHWQVSSGHGWTRW